MIWNLLDEAATGNGGNGFGTIAIGIGVIVVIFIVFMLFSNRSSKRRQQEYTEQLEAIQPGHKVRTIGGICGIVVEVCDDNTVVIETGSEKSGRSYIKMDKDCIAQTDAKGPTQIAREEAEARKAAEKNAKKGGTQPADFEPTEPVPPVEPVQEPSSEGDEQGE